MHSTILLHQNASKRGHLPPQIRPYIYFSECIIYHVWTSSFGVLQFSSQWLFVSVFYTIYLFDCCHITLINFFEGKENFCKLHLLLDVILKSNDYSMDFNLLPKEWPTKVFVKSWLWYSDITFNTYSSPLEIGLSQFKDTLIFLCRIY